MNAERLFVLPILVTAVALVPGSVAASGLALVAVPVWYSSFSARSHQRALVGSVFPMAGIVFAGMQGIESAFLVIATIGLLLGWSTTTNFVGLREQLDDTATIDRAVFANAGTTLAASATIGAVVYAAFLVGPTLNPLALVFIFLGTVPILLGLEWLGRQ